MTSIAKTLLLLPLICSVVAAECTTPAQRRAWHTFTNDEKLAYINAELCLMELPAKTDLNGPVTRFDDLQAVHVYGAYMVHFVGAFLPFHRLLMYAHETALREECGYEGYQPYWYEQKDAGQFSSSDVLDPVYGFGGDGSGDDNCITDGPFANYTNRIGPGYEVRDHCIDRQVNDGISASSAQENIDDCTSQADWISAWNCIEGLPHLGGHGGVGGEMLNPVSSPGDPTFYLHHTFLDKVWWDWQAKDLPARFTEMGGNNVLDLSNGFPGMLPPTPPEFPPATHDGDPGNTTTLGHVLNMYGNMENKTIADVMNIQGDFLCYEYVEPE
ncbi:hypothetical protein FQN55_001262 [Onygenales sp. PD_40]|nr:hypothetical protein FQN55_001262 [Onygenales sp. PD_40]KAK2795220.1 hypothetical protein FQN52_006150 [Onygenales sp. PD_12]